MNEINLNEYFKNLIPSVTEKYFEENKSKILAEISGRISLEMERILGEIGSRTTIIIKYLE